MSRRNAIERSRIAHAYLFVGPRGTGKTSTARILAKIPEGNRRHLSELLGGEFRELKPLTIAPNAEMAAKRKGLAKEGAGAENAHVL